MVCIYCGKDTRVTNSRSSKSSRQVWRRRQCNSCNALFSTFERPDYLGSLLVQQSSGTLNPFSKDCLYISIYESCKHRLGAVSDATELTDTIINKLLKSINNGGIVSRSDIVAVSSYVLRRFDTAAAVYYLAYHKP